MSTDTSTILTEPPVAGTEVDTLLGSLERQRRTFAWKAGGLDSAALRVTLGPSSVTLGGLLKHLALVEDHYFTSSLAGRPMPEPWASADWDADPDWEWTSAADDTPEQLTALWQESVTRSRAAVTEALADGGLDHPVPGRSTPEGEHASLRRVLVDLIEEYARHVGQADLVRESIDGLVGEDPPA